MASAIEAIYDALAETSITVNTVSVAVKDADELPNSVAAANLPVRLLTPIAAFGLEAGAETVLVGSSTGGNPYDVNWYINDVMLWSKVISDTGVKAHAKDLISYCAQYYEMARTFGASYNVIDVQLVPDVINYPQGSNDWFYGVRAVLTIKEKF